MDECESSHHPVVNVGLLLPEEDYKGDSSFGGRHVLAYKDQAPESNSRKQARSSKEEATFKQRTLNSIS